MGAAAGDPDSVRVQKATLTLAAVTVTGLAVIWVGVYLALGLPISAGIPFVYQVASISSLVVFARTGSASGHWSACSVPSSSTAPARPFRGSSPSWS
jgi:hypothetical protein